MSTPLDRSAQLPPWATTIKAREALEVQIRSIIGSSIVAVSYLEPVTASTIKARSGQGYDIANVGVEFKTMAGPIISAVWRMEGYNEGLSFGPGDAESRHGLYALHRLDVTRSAQWQPLLGTRIVDVASEWHIANGGCPEAIWAVRLEFEGARTLLIALGRSGTRGVIDYQPDEVVVIFDEAMASRYQSSVQT